MDVETRNICFCDHDQKMWFRYYTECIPFGFMLVPDNSRPIVNDLEENRVKEKKKEKWHRLIGPSAFPIEVQAGTDTTTHHFLLH